VRIKTEKPGRDTGGVLDYGRASRTLNFHLSCERLREQKRELKQLSASAAAASVSFSLLYMIINPLSHAPIIAIPVVCVLTWVIVPLFLRNLPRDTVCFSFPFNLSRRKIFVISSSLLCFNLLGSFFLVIIRFFGGPVFRALLTRLADAG
jgi:hypothetical protein